MAGPLSSKGFKLLNAMVQKFLANDSRFSGVEYRILAPPPSGQAFTIELSKGRCSRQVFVESLTIQRMGLSRQAEPRLIRELRTTILRVIRLSQKSR